MAPDFQRVAAIISLFGAVGNQISLCGISVALEGDAPSESALNQSQSDSIMAGSILIAEHDVGLGQALQRCLAMRGYDVVVTRNGLECIEQLQTMIPAVLVLDPDIPWGGAAGVLEWLLQEEPLYVPQIAIAQDERSLSIPETLVKSFIYSQLARPHDLNDLLPFVTAIEHMAESSSKSLSEVGSELFVPSE